MNGLFAAFARLTPREKWLVGTLLGLMLVIGAIWFALLPGVDAARIAENRRVRAADELAYVRQLSSQIAAARTVAASLPLEQASGVISESALEAGVQVLSTSVEGAVVRVQVDAPGSSRLLQWVDAASAKAAMGVRSVTLRKGEGGALVGDILFSREGP